MTGVLAHLNRELALFNLAVDSKMRGRIRTSQGALPAVKSRMESVGWLDFHLSMR